MTTTNLKPNTVQATNLDALLSMTATMLDACQKFSDLGVQAMKENIADYQENVHKALAANGAQAWFALQADAIEPAAERARSYLRQAQEIAAETRADFQQVTEAQYESGLRTMQQALENLSQNAPTGSENALNAWQSAVTSTAALYESMQQATKHAIEFAGYRVAEAAATASSAAQKANAQAAVNR